MKHALGLLAKSPGFTAVAVLTLALGIGANTALFSIFQRLVLPPLDLPEPDRLVRVWASNPDRNLLAPVVSTPQYELLAAEQQSFSGFAASLINGFILARERAEPEQLPALQVTVNWLPTLGLSLVRGRNFTADEDSPGGPRVVILTEDCWRSRFGASESILGETLLLSGTPHTVIGVVRTPLPPPVAFAQLIVPRALEGVGLTPEQIRSGIGFLEITARLKPGVSLQEANTEIHALVDRYRRAYPTNLDARNRAELRPWTEEIVGNIRPTLLVLLAAVALVLLIACANVSNLFLSRLTARHREIAVRISLGATRGSLLRQFLSESALFCLLSTALGLLLATWSLEATEKLFASRLPAGTTFTLDGFTLAFTVALSALTCAAVGLVPALQASNLHLADALKEAARGSTGGHRGGRLRSCFVVIEVAFSVLLLVGSSLLLVSFLKLQATPPGFNPHGAATTAINIPTTHYRTPEHWLTHLDQILQNLHANPQVKHAAAATNVPAGFLSVAPRGIYALQGRPLPPIDERPLAFLTAASEDYFRTLGIPLRSGRFFTRDDRADTTSVAIVNESFAKKLFPDGNALGRVILRGPDGKVAHEIVGVVGDVKSQGLHAPAPDTLYLALRQNPAPFVSLVARTDGDAAALQNIFRSAVHTTDRNTVVTLFQTLEAGLSNTLGFQRIVASLTSIFAGLAVLLAALGLYSVLAYAVAQRTNEIGIRIALGATTRQVLALVLGQGLKLVTFGLAAGLVIAAAASHLLQQLLFNVERIDPRLYAAVALLFIVIGAVACLLPAFRAAKVDPLTALRSD